MTLPKSITAELKDGENLPVLFDYGYTLRERELTADMAAIFQRHGRDICLLPLSAMSSGDGVLSQKPATEKPIIALHLQPVTQPQIQTGRRPDLAHLGLDEIIIDTANQLVHAGAGITLAQLNAALEQKLGGAHMVLGADLTSCAYARVGATFMTGGMGPQRRYFSDSVVAACLYDGTANRIVHGGELGAFAGTFGWTGLITAVSCRYVRLRGNEFGFAIPVPGAARELGNFLQHFAPYCIFQEAPALTGDAPLVLGLEHISLSAMEPMLLQHKDSAMGKQAQNLARKCRQQGVEDLLFVSGYAQNSAADLLHEWVDDPEAEVPTIAGIELENAVAFTRPETMRELREAIPQAARTQQPEGQFVHKSHTDLTIRLHPERIRDGMAALWRANQEYVRAVKTYFTAHPEIDGQVLLYGHLNPYGVNPHNRLTMASTSEPVFAHAVAFVTAARSSYYRAMEAVCTAFDAQYIGGEKGVGSEASIIRSFPDLESVPTTLRAKFLKQAVAVREATPLFNWRAVSPYR